jgi:hypothetical protein
MVRFAEEERDRHRLGNSDDELADAGRGRGVGGGGVGGGGVSFLPPVVIGQGAQHGGEGDSYQRGEDSYQRGGDAYPRLHSHAAHLSTAFDR